LLLWSVGSGKTRTALEAVVAISSAKPWLVVATRRIAVDGRVWQSEAAEWGIPLVVQLAHGNARQRAAGAAVEADLYVTTYDLLHTPEIQALARRCDGVIFDELSMAKSFSRRFRAGRKATEHMTWKWGLTATPATEHLSDLFYVVQMLDDGVRFGRSRDAFMHTYFRKMDLYGHIWKLKRDSEALIFGELNGLAHRVTVSDLPGVITDLIKIPLEKSQRSLYRQLEKDLIALVGDRDLVIGSTAVLAGKLRQLCSGFLYRDGAVVRLSESRLNALAELRELLGEDRLLVVYELAEDLRAIRAANPDYITLDDADAVGRWNRGEVPGLVIHARSGGHGLNLQHGGYHLLWYLLPWSAELLIQVRGRLARPGQREANIIEHVFITPDSIETERVWPGLLGKIAAEQRLLDSVELGGP
jgi:SNF2 family DNA or RNA helicase